MKSLLKKFLPKKVLDGYRRVRRSMETKRNRRISTEEVFTAIYQNNKWGGEKGELCSGSGTTDERVVAAYVELISALSDIDGFLGTEFVDLGCGDFRVGSRLLPFCSRYTGVDIVKPVIERNQTVYGDEKTRFVHLNIVEDDLPDGDVCFVRQVLQHLSNEQILRILPKLEKYRWVFLTEHYPDNNIEVVPNLDKTQGHDIRLYDDSGVYLTEPPFSLPADCIEEVLEVRSGDGGNHSPEGIIRTFRYIPARSAMHPRWPD